MTLKFSVCVRILDEAEALEQFEKMESKNKVANPQAFVGDTFDISKGGLGIYIDSGSLAGPLEKDGLVEMVMNLPGSKVRCLGTVAWIINMDAHRVKAGIAFVELDKEALGHVERIIAECLNNSRIELT
jgi:hypothetical protein